ncbi:hypothetical protein E4U21_003610 [Claviceps maximensis]|nr:hypothetical protein E4U21_003610 [Claviceps maximensis]
MVSVKNLLFLAVSVSALFTPPTNSFQLTDLKNLNDDLLALIQSVKEYNGGGDEGVSSIVNANKKYLTDAKQLIDTINKQKSISDSEGGDIIKYVGKVIQPNSDNFLQEVKSKKSLFEENGLIEQAKLALEALQTSTELLNNAFAKRASLLNILKMNDIVKKFRDNFTSAIGFLSKKN